MLSGVIVKKLFIVGTALALLTAQAHASAGFSCETAEKEIPRVVVAGATPRSGGALINFGAVLETGDRKIEFKQSDVKGFTWNAKGIHVRVMAQDAVVKVTARRNPKDEDDWSGTYEVTQGVADKKSKVKANVIRGKVKCFVE